MSLVKNLNHLNFFKDFIKGSIAVSISKTLASPLEVMKFQIQNMDELLKQKIINEPYKNIPDCFYKLIKQNGIKSLYKGNLTNILFEFPQQSVNFAIKPYFRRIFGKNKKIKNNKIVYNILSGSFAGMTSMLLFHPFDFARTKISLDMKNKIINKEQKYNGIVDLYKKEYEKIGIKGIYRGLPASCLCMFVYRGLYFGLFDTIKPLTNNSNFGKFLLGWGVTALSGAIAYPLDTVRKRMISSSGEENQYKNSYKCLKYIIEKEGVKSLYKGHLVNILRSIVGAGVLVIFEKLKKF
jgi:solute carrier family 25 (adenine nucleotide translocator) protein 4/5/6/31